MDKLPKFTLSFDKVKNNWALENDSTNRIIKRFDTKKDATKGGVLKKASGSKGASVKIRKLNGRFQEERTYPRGRDPKSSKG